MSEFVHLHLHTEFSLLDGACRIDELLDQAVKLKMPAIAVTEHGNMFSSVIFHDHARARGVNPILGCEVYVAPGSRHTKSGNPGETQNHLVLLAETLEGYHNLIKLVSAGYTEGFYYKPRIDKELLAQHSKGLIGLSSCLKGEVAEGLSHQQDRKRHRGGGDLSRHPRPRQLLPRDAVARHRRAADRQRRLARNRAGSGLPLVCTNDVHYLRESDAHPHDVLLCIGTGKAFSDPKRLRYDAQAVLPEDAGGDGRGVQGLSGRAGQHGAHRRALQRHAPERRRIICRISTCPAGFTLDDVLRARRARGLQGAAAAPAAARRRPARLRHTIDEYERRLDYEIDMIRKTGFQGYFLIVWDFIRYAREQGIPVGPGRGSAAGSLVGLVHADRRRRSDGLRPVFERFLNPERISHAGHRRRLLRAAAGRGHRLRHAEVRPRERGADHHVRHDEGEGGRARRRTRAGDAVRRRGQGRQADSTRARHDARQGARGERRPSRRWSRTTRR